MLNYDFSTLNDKEFESFGVQIVGKKLNVFIERFKPGKDKGVDGRYFKIKKGEVIVQCKHWVKSSFDDLFTYLKKTELAKVQALNPESYILIVSHELSRENKKKIFKLFQPFIKSESDIYDRTNLNQLLFEFPEIEKQNFKLWITSTNVLSAILNSAIYGRSSAKLDTMLEKTKRYVFTKNHEKAGAILKDKHTVIIAGEPGSGKSTLAEQLCIELVSQEYAFFSINESVKEAEDVFSNEEKQVFYFDDFLGRNYLQAIEGNKDSAICSFIERVSRNKNKRFILTSRTNILNQGDRLSEQFRIHNLDKNRHEIRVDTLSKLEKAHMLYNHVWYSSLKESYIEQIYFKKRYHGIINHKNFNPRLISFLVDFEKVKSIDFNNYWKYIADTLNNPTDIWQNLFDVQIDIFGRWLVFLVAFNGKPISEDRLQKAYEEIVSTERLLPTSHIQNDFFALSRLMVGALLNRNLDRNGNTTYDLFNPSLGDFVYKRKDSPEIIFKSLKALLTYESLSLFNDLNKSGVVKPEVYSKHLRGLLHSITSASIPKEITTRYLVRLGLDLITNLGHDVEIFNTFEKLFKTSYRPDQHQNEEETVALFLLLAEKSNNSDVTNILVETIKSNIQQFDHLQYNSILKIIKLADEESYQEVEDELRNLLTAYLKEEFENAVYEAEVFGPQDIGSIESSEEQVEDYLEDFLSDYNFKINDSKKRAILNSCRLHKIEERIIESSYDRGSDYGYSGGSSYSGAGSEDSQIDDLFDK